MARDAFGVAGKLGRKDARLIVAGPVAERRNGRALHEAPGADDLEWLEASPDELVHFVTKGGAPRPPAPPPSVPARPATERIPWEHVKFR